MKSRIIIPTNKTIAVIVLVLASCNVNGDIEEIVPGLDNVKNFMWHINAIIDFFKGGIDSALDYIKLWKSYFSDILADIGQFPQFLASMLSMIPPQLLRLFTLSILCIGGLWLFRKLRS